MPKLWPVLLASSLLLARADGKVDRVARTPRGAAGVQATLDSVGRGPSARPLGAVPSAAAEALIPKGVPHTALSIPPRRSLGGMDDDLWLTEESPTVEDRVQTAVVHIQVLCPEADCL